MSKTAQISVVNCKVCPYLMEGEFVNRSHITRKYICGATMRTMTDAPPRGALVYGNLEVIPDWCPLEDHKD